MAHPVGRPGMAPTTAFGRRGVYWSCLRNSQGGIHTGADWAWKGIHGHPVYAVESGHLRRRFYGRKAFGSKQVAISPNGPGEWFYAHMSWIDTSLIDKWVEAGTMIGRVGREGNVTGPHLHLEWKKSKNHWSCGDHMDPWPEIQRLAGDDWQFPKGHKVYLSKTRFGGHESNDDGTSDSIIALQEMLNRHSLKAPGNVTIPTIGKYGPMTDTVVRADQDQHGGTFGQKTPDREGKSNVGPMQMAHLIDSTGAPYTIVDDREKEPEKPVWKFPEGHKVYLSKLRYGGHESNQDGTSDSISALQEMLGDVPVTGKYLDMTDAAVIEHQEAHGFGSDPVGASFVGPKQLTHLIETSGAPYVMVDDRNTDTERDPFPPGMKGIDISSHQAGIPLDKVDADFVIVKATEGKTYRSHHDDPVFEAQYEQAKAAGKLVGIYHYARNNEPEEEADWFLEVIGDRVGEAVLVLDWERDPRDDVDWVKRWLDRVYMKTGVRAMVYMNTHDNGLTDWSEVGEHHPLWIAKYRDMEVDPNYDMSNAGPDPAVNWPGGWLIWQWTSSGRLDGWDGNLDLNWAPKMTPESWAALATPDKPGEVSREEFAALKQQVEGLTVKVDLLAKSFAQLDVEVGGVKDTINEHVPAALRGLADLLEDE